MTCFTSQWEDFRYFQIVLVPFQMSFVSFLFCSCPIQVFCSKVSKQALKQMTDRTTFKYFRCRELAPCDFLVSFVHIPFLVLLEGATNRAWSRLATGPTECRLGRMNCFCFPPQISRFCLPTHANGPTFLPYLCNIERRGFPRTACGLSAHCVSNRRRALRFICSTRFRMLQSRLSLRCIDHSEWH